MGILTRAHDKPRTRAKILIEGGKLLPFISTLARQQRRVLYKLRK